jgi:hypothetical protein
VGVANGIRNGVWVESETKVDRGRDYGPRWDSGRGKII